MDSSEYLGAWPDGRIKYSCRKVMGEWSAD